MKVVCFCGKRAWEGSGWCGREEREEVKGKLVATNVKFIPKRVEAPRGGFKELHGVNSLPIVASTWDE